MFDDEEAEDLEDGMVMLKNRQSSRLTIKKKDAVRDAIVKDKLLETV